MNRTELLIKIFYCLDGLPKPVTSSISQVQILFS